MTNQDNQKPKNKSLKEAVSKTYVMEAIVFEDKEKESGYQLFGNKKQQTRMQKVIAILEKSEEGKYLLEKAKENGYSIGFERGIEDMGVCSYEHKSVTINDTSNDFMAVSVLAHELRHACQYSNGMNLYALSDNTKTQIQINRAMEADAEANAGFIALDLKLQGIDGPWKEFTKDAPEVAKAMLEELEKNGGDLHKNKTKILLAGFKGWYNDFNIREQYDSQQIEILDKIREENIMNVVAFDRTCPANIIVRKICKTRELGNYFNDNNESPDLLDSRHYLGISRINMNLINDYFQERRSKYNIQPDDSLEDIPTYKYINNKNDRAHRGNTKSVYWESIIKVKNAAEKSESKKVAIEKNKKRYIETQSILKPVNTSLLNDKNIHMR